MACLKSLSLGERKLEIPEIPDADAHDAFLDRFCQTASAILRSPEWSDASHVARENDIHDLIDGRVLRSCAINAAWVDREADFSSRMEGCWSTILKCYQDISDLIYRQGSRLTGKKNKAAKAKPAKGHASTALLPFENKVFDKHLASVRVKVDESYVETYGNAIRDNRHWYNGKQLVPEHSQQQPFTKRRDPTTWNQVRFREMEKYAKSLMGNVPDPLPILSPELRKPQPKGNSATMRSKGKKIAHENEVKKLTKDESSWIDSWKKKVK